MLSYSTGSSGSGTDVEKVTEATALVRERAPELLVEGPIQYDAAIDAAVARTKLPDSAVAGRATVFVFPDLNTGNNTYKAVQRSAGALAVGPVLQGLRKPVNDLSRGALVRDIVNTVAITAIQAQGLPAQKPAHDLMAGSLVLVVNAGSSSLKYSLVDGDTGAAAAVGAVERIGEETGSLTHEVDGDRASRGAAVPARSRTRSRAAVDAFDDARPRDRRRCARRGRAPRRARRCRSSPRRRWSTTTCSRPSRTWCRWRRCTTRPTSRAARRARLLFPDVPAGRGVRHRLPPDDAAGGVHLRGAARVARGAPDPSLRLPRHVARVRRRAPPPPSSARAVDEHQPRGAAPRQRRLGDRRARRPVGRHLDGADAAWKAW